MTRWLLAFLLGIIMPVAAGAQPKRLEVQVMRTSADSLFANITLIKGEKKAVLVDAPFTRADAHRVVAMVLESGRQLETIFITHDHPDHFFSMEVLTEAFPQVKIVADKTVAADIWRSLPLKVKRWGPVLGANGPRMPTAPLALPQDSFELEGHKLQVIGPMAGDHAHATALWVPDAYTLVAGDLLFNDMFLWLAEHDKADRAAWLASLDRLESLGADVVVPGHSRPGTANDKSAFAYTRGFLQKWELNVAASRNSEELRARIKAQYPTSIDVLGDFILGTSSRVSMGEEPRWTE